MVTYQHEGSVLGRWIDARKLRGAYGDQIALTMTVALDETDDVFEVQVEHSDDLIIIGEDMMQIGRETENRGFGDAICRLGNEFIDAGMELRWEAGDPINPDT